MKRRGVASALRMRVRASLLAAAVLCGLVLTGLAGADLVPVELLLAYGEPPPGQARIYIYFNGEATQWQNGYSAGSSFITSREESRVTFAGSCDYLVDQQRVVASYNALCDAGKGYVEISATDRYTRWNPVTGAAQSCLGKGHFRRNAHWLIGGTLTSSSEINLNDSAPLIDTIAVPSANQFILKSSNPRLGCTAVAIQNPPTASPTGNSGHYWIRGLMPFPGRTSNTWTASISTDPRSQGEATFHASFSISVEKRASLPPKEELAQQTKAAEPGLLERFNQWWNDLMNSNAPSGTTDSLDLPDGVLRLLWFTGTHTTNAPLLRATGRSARSTALFAITQPVHQGRNTLTPKLTSLGRAELAGSVNMPTSTGVVTFTPTHGGPVTLAQTFTSRVEPHITSVQFAGDQAHPTIIIRGRGLAPLPKQDPVGSPAGHNGCPAETGKTGSDYGVQLQVNDFSRNWAAGFSIPTATSCIGLIPTKVAPNELDLQLGSFYSQYYPKFTLAPGDDVQVTANGAAIAVHVAYGAPVTK